MESRFRGNDVIFERAIRRISAVVDSTNAGDPSSSGRAVLFRMTPVRVFL
jgi:hypothetical protein